MAAKGIRLSSNDGWLVLHVRFTQLTIGHVVHDEQRGCKSVARYVSSV